MAKRKPITNPNKDKRVFTNTAKKTKSINLGNVTMRGGTRL